MAHQARIHGLFSCHQTDGGFARCGGILGGELLSAKTPSESSRRGGLEPGEASSPPAIESCSTCSSPDQGDYRQILAQSAEVLHDAAAEAMRTAATSATGSWVFGASPS